MAGHLYGLGDFDGLLRECDISTCPVYSGFGRKYRVFVGLPARRPVRAGGVIVFRRRRFYLYVGTFRSTETLWAIYRKLAAKFPDTMWRVSQV